jgi:hypothetical protein
MTGAAIPVPRGWLELRETADAAARSRELVDRLRDHLPDGGVTVVHDLACGTGAMGRWLAPQLPGPQCWVLHDWDAGLLGAAEADPPGEAADGAPVTVEPRQSDITRLALEDVTGASLFTASALLDLMTLEEFDRLITVCTRVACPVLLTLSVVGNVHLTPADRLDHRIAAAFDAHQRRLTPRGRLLGPDAVAAAVDRFGRAGCDVLVRPSPWQLGPAESALASVWLAGWLDAACEQDADLLRERDRYERRRLSEAGAGRLRVTVDHADLLALPR